MASITELNWGFGVVILFASSGRHLHVSVFSEDFFCAYPPIIFNAGTWGQRWICSGNNLKALVRFGEAWKMVEDMVGPRRTSGHQRQGSQRGRANGPRCQVTEGHHHLAMYIAGKSSFAKRTFLHPISIACLGFALVSKGL
ncbi:unnamed protein product [Urochloa humidicola]